MKQVLPENFIGNPVVRQRRPLEMALIIRRRAVRSMGIPVMHMQHPVILLPISFQPVQHMGRHHFRGFPSPVPHIEAFMKASIEPPGRMALRKGGKGHRMKACPPKLHEQPVLRHQIRKAPAFPLQTHIRRCAAVSHDSIMDAVLPGNQRCPGRQAGRVGTIIAVKADALLRHAVHHRRGIPAVPVTAHMIRPQGINIKHYYSHCIFSLFSLCLHIIRLISSCLSLHSPAYRFARISEGVVL